MEQKIIEISSKFTILQKDVDELKGKYIKMEKIENDLNTIKTTVAKMEMVDKNIFDKLDFISNSVKIHKDTFVNHDKKEMEKYGEIDKRLIKIERVLYMLMGAMLLLELLNKFHLLSLS